MAATRVSGETLADLELQVIDRFLGSKGKLLDLGCGRGRGSVHFALEGFEVVGVDFDPPTIRDAKQFKKENGASCEFVLADGRSLCFRDQALDFVVSFGSTLSEKHRSWMQRPDRLAIISEASRVTRPGGLLLVNFVHRYWNLRGFFAFLEHYWMWARERMAGKRTEFGDYTEVIGKTPIRFHAFTLREAKSLFPTKGIRLAVWRRSRGLFTDWFFIAAKKIA